MEPIEIIIKTLDASPEPMKAGEIAEVAGLDKKEVDKKAESVQKDIKDQVIHKNELFEKINRVLDCKKRFFKEYQPVYIPSLSKQFKADRHKNLLERIAQDPIHF